MKQFKRALQMALILPFACSVADAQTNLAVTPVKAGYLLPMRQDGVIENGNIPEEIKPWQQIAAKDVFFKKRVWREIDIRQKQNMVFQYPGDDETGGGMYIEILLAAVREGRVQAFADDRFTIPLTNDQLAKKILGEPQTVTIIHPEDGTETDSVIYPKFNPTTVTKFRLKEDWIFDANEGRMKVRIIGLAPYQDRYAADGSFRATAPLFWLYYPELRVIHTQYKVYNGQNDVHRESWDDFFEQRNFSSSIIRSTLNNPLQEAIADHKQGVDALYTSEEIADVLFKKEHDLWGY